MQENESLGLIMNGGVKYMSESMKWCYLGCFGYVGM